MGFYQNFSCESSCDAVLWNNNGDELIVSFYDRLDEQRLKGSIAVYQFVNTIHSNGENSSVLKLKQVIDHKNHGILHICPINDRTIAIADSSGYINLLLRQYDQPHNYKIQHTACESSDQSMCLYMDYNQSNQQLWYSCQNGHVGLTKYDGATEFKTLRTYSDCHQFEAWYVCCFDENIAITGGDDGKVCVLDSRMDSPVRMINKYFTSGVTSVVSVSHSNSCGGGPTFMVGSFDESISLWDLRSSFRQPIRQFDNLGGQLWRMRWDSHNSRRLACAMMQSESAVFEFDALFSDIKVIHRAQRGVAQLVYGIEWHPDIKNLLVSCSHKDKHLEIFDIN